MPPKWATAALTRIDQIAVLLLQSLPCLLLGTSRLRHDKLDIVLLDLGVSSRSGSLGLVLARLQLRGPVTSAYARGERAWACFRLHSLVAALHQVLEALGHTILESTGGVSLLGGLAAGGQLGLGAQLGSRVGVLDSGFTKDNVRVGSW